jgi:hypothetical protein
MAGRPTNSWVWLGRQANEGRAAGPNDVPTLTANILAAATNRTNLNSKTSGTCH